MNLQDRLRATALFLLAAHGPVSFAADEAAKPYRLSVWADVRFDAEGRAGKPEFVEAQQLPATFLAHLEQKVSAFTLPRTEGEATTSLESGVLTEVEIQPAANGSSAKVLQIRAMPRLLQQDRANPLRLKLKGEWSGSFLVRCRIGVNGRCAKPETEASANLPPEIQKIIKAVASGWRFAPQKRDGQAVEGDYETQVEVEADTSAPPRRFGKEI